MAKPPHWLKSSVPKPVPVTIETTLKIETLSDEKKFCPFIYKFNVTIETKKNKINKQSLIYINRLSDFLFVISRVTNDNGKSDILWVPGENQ